MTRLRLFTSVILIAVFCVASIASPATVLSGELGDAPLEGIWSVISMTDGGETLPKNLTQGVRFVFSGGTGMPAGT